MDKAPSGALELINMFDGRWEMEARWVLKVAMTVGDWKEPLYTCYLLLVLVHICLCCEDGCITYNVVTVGLINTGPSERRWFFVFSRNRPFNKICSVFHTCILGIRIPKVLNSCDCSHCKASTPFVRPLLGLRQCKIN